MQTIRSVTFATFTDWRRTVLETIFLKAFLIIISVPTLIFHLQIELVSPKLIAGDVHLLTASLNSI
jgi:hypothetical protein